MANGLCHPWALDYGSQAVMTWFGVWWGLFLDWVVVLIGAMQAPVQYRRSLNRLVPSFHLSTGISKRLDPGSSKLARDDTVYSLMVLVSGEPFHHFTFPPFHLKNTFPPIVAPIYYEGDGPHLHHPPRTGSSWGHPYKFIRMT